MRSIRIADHKGIRKMAHLTIKLNAIVEPRRNKLDATVEPANHAAFLEYL
ncbi:hypothetical protein GF312_14375 [Candidatus Poribacteria bacterium]|nr:hypothetical protein [Candidatus Poribacteria bacterium]